MSRVAVIGGGRSGEHDVSLASAVAVAEALGGRFWTGQAWNRPWFHCPVAVRRWT